MNTSIHSEPEPVPRPVPSESLRQTRHDIRGALHVVIGMAKVLAISDTLTPSQKDIVDTLKRNAERAAELLEDMSEPSLPTGRPAPGGSMEFPLLQKEERDEEGGNQQIFIRQRKPLALLVEDSAPNARIAAAYLTELGYDHDLAESGQQALEKFSHGSYDVIIMDVQMPGMDGLEATRRIRALEKKSNKTPTPILATTGNATEDDKLFCAKAGMNGCLAKPFEPEDLKKKLHEVTQGTSHE